MGKETDVCCWNPKKLWNDFKIKGVSTKMNKFYKNGAPVDTMKMRQAVSEGPISSAVAVNKDFQFYSSGVLSKMKCPAAQLNHAVVTVGYTND